ncbi:NAD(P)/FAD-dependent oxidoreductase [Pleurocapsales cyanobacterium LEGE 06147]|nr:NAD(P)/FAD-dependent oxidoreductase [Pleurocapsales cyanobacterium LEGE 06147]
MQDFDAVIIGAGPAGCQCARTLAKSNHKVLLVEQHENFEQNNFSSAATPLKTLEQFNLPETIVGTFWQKITIVTNNISRDWDSPERLGAVLNFAKLRGFLAQKVQAYGGEVWLGYRYVKYDRKNDRTRVFLQRKGGDLILVTTKVLVDATGFTRAVIYPSKRDKPSFLKGTGIEYLIEVEEQNYTKVSNCLTFFLGSKWMPKGYSWLFPMEHKLLKVGAARIHGEHLKIKQNEPLKKYIQLLITDYLKTSNYKIIDVHGSILEYSPGLNDIYYQDNIIAIGDAVSTVNFLGGEGIRHGMYGAEIAAKYIQKYLCNQLSSFKPYQKEMKRYFSFKWNLSEQISRKVYLGYDDSSFEQKVSTLTALKTEDLIDILFFYKFEKAYKLFGGYLKKKILFLLQNLFR